MKIRLNPVVVDTQWELHVLGKYLETMEAQLQDATHIDKATIDTQLKLRPDMDDVEHQDLLQAHYQYYGKHFPSKLRYSFVLLIWTTIESHLRATCDRLAKQFKRNLTLGDIRADDILARNKKYLERVVGVRIPDASLWAELQMLQKARNCIVHANGIVKDIQNPGDRTCLDQYFKRNRGLSRDPWGAIAIGSGYCRRILHDVEQFFHDIFHECGWETDKQGRVIQ